MTSPYKELKYYEEGDSENFAGREQDVHQLLSRVVISRVFVLYARSGLGKTSVLLAGLFPSFESATIALSTFARWRIRWGI